MSGSEPLRCLIIDDHPVVRQGIRALLEREIDAVVVTDAATPTLAFGAANGESPDVVNLIPEYNEPRRFLRLADDLAKRGWSAARIEKILGANFARLFTEVWG